MRILRRWFRRDSPLPEEGEALTEFRIREIENVDLTEADIPGPDADWSTWPGMNAFAASFNGYRHWGSLEKCFDVTSLARTGNPRDRTLTELRTDLFCLYRTVCNEGDSTADDVRQAQAILAEIRDRVRLRAID